MKYLKTYELNFFDEEPKIGDYILCSEKTFKNNDLEYFINNNIGKFIDIIYLTDRTYYVVEYKNIPKNLGKNFEKKYTKFKISYTRNFYWEEIVAFSSNKKDLEYIISANKYNI